MFSGVRANRLVVFSAIGYFFGLAFGVGDAGIRFERELIGGVIRAQGQDVAAIVERPIDGHGAAGIGQGSAGGEDAFQQGGSAVLGKDGSAVRPVIVVFHDQHVAIGDGDRPGIGKIRRGINGKGAARQFRRQEFAVIRTPGEIADGLFDFRVRGDFRPDDLTSDDSVVEIHPLGAHALACSITRMRAS